MSAARWIFGYGSLIWRPAFAFAERRPAWLDGHRRVFAQGSTDHRGVPGAPGRVVTLEARPGARCAGVAYRLPADGAEAALAALDHRESGGYVRLEVELALDGDAGPRVAGLVYRADPGNPNYLGPAPLATVAAQVRRARGPSGPNDEYVLRLAAALRQLGVEDDPVFEVAEAVAALAR